MQGGADDAGWGKRQMSKNAAPRVLVVDDNEVNRFVAWALLRKLGCVVDTAQSGREALDACSKSVYDVVFMDYHMPVMDGLEATKAIRTLEGEAGSTRIVALTADTTGDVEKRWLEAGANGYLHKPIRLESLREVLRRD
jgi:two-component system, sensor histidine kinase